jgi:RNA polymerase sigma factor (sigma-70 family)
VRSDIAEPAGAERPIEHGVDDLRSVVGRAQGGDLAAYEALVVRFQDLAVGYAYARLGDLHLAEDVAQEAFLQAHRDLPALRDPAAFPGWFRRLVGRQCGRVARSKRVRVVPLAEAADVLSPAPGPAAAAEVRERQEAVWRAVRGLPAGERAAVALFYLGGYRQEEVSRFLGLPPTTVNNRLHAARERLRRSMLAMVDEDLHGARPSRDPRFVAGVLRTLAPRPEVDAPRIYAALEARAMGWGRTQWRDGRVAHSRFDWATSRIGLVDDRLVTVFGVYDLTMRVGSAGVRTAGVNLEYTNPEYTDPGYAGADGPAALAQTAAASVAAMRARGYDLSVAFGREALFAGLGYAAGWRETMWFVRTGDLPEGPPGGALEPFEPVHRDDLAALYNREHEGLTGTAVRPTYLRNKHPGEQAGYLWRGPDGAPAGYVVVGPDGTAGWRNAALLGDNHRGFERLLWHDESAGDPEARLGALGQLARRWGCPEVAFDRLHYLSPLGRRLRRGRCRIEQEYRRYVVRVVNLRTLFEKLAPELGRRLGASPLAGWAGDLAIAASEERIVLGIERGRVEVRAAARTAAPNAIEGGPELAQLVVGGEAPLETVLGAGIALRGEAGRLLDVLFPPQHPQMDNQAL